HLESSYELVAKLILKDFRVSFLYFFIQKRCWRSSPTSKSIEPEFLEPIFFAKNGERKSVCLTKKALGKRVLFYRELLLLENSKKE
ncbi:hypothetical protein, partial [Enterococcus durans]|uniref:hypothetical protein n=1 Tax=Enterococcus durans TaxID=53345 RepID=UPI0039A5A351